MGKNMAVGVHCILALLILSGADLGRSDGSDHRYKEGDSVPLYANKVGPFHNPSELYTITRRLLPGGGSGDAAKDIWNGGSGIVGGAGKGDKIVGGGSDLTAGQETTPPAPPAATAGQETTPPAATAGQETTPPAPPAATAGQETTPSPSGGKECSTDKLQMILGGIILFYMFSNY